MPDARSHRGAHPEDGRLFAPAEWPRLGAAVVDFSWLVSRGYADPSALKLVGDRYQLSGRQRLAVMRCACSDEALHYRKLHEVSVGELSGHSLHIDGYNVLTTIETALAGGVVLHARDGCYRDIAAMHGTFRKVEETLPAIDLIGQSLVDMGVTDAIWYFDSPVSNSGRLKAAMMRLAVDRAWSWRVELVANPDTILSQSPDMIATADGIVLNRCRHWVNLARAVVTARIPGAHIVDICMDCA